MKGFMIRRFILLLCFLQASIFKTQTLTSTELINAWSDSSLNQSISYHNTEQNLNKNFDNKKANDLIIEIEAYLEKHPSTRLSARLTMYNEARFVMLNKKTDQYSIKSIENAIKQIKQLGDKQLLTELHTVYNEKDFEGDNISLPDKYSYVLQQEKIGAQYFPTLYKRYFYLSYYNYRSQNYDHSILLAERCLQLLEQEEEIVDYNIYFKVLDILGALYNEKNNPKKGMFFYKKLDKVSQDYFKNDRTSSYVFVGGYNTFDWSIVAKGGIGQSLMSEGKYNEAKGLLLESYKDSHAQKEYYNEGKVLVLLGQCAYQQANYQEAISYYEKGLIATNLAGSDTNSRLKALLGLSNVYEKIGNKDVSDSYFARYREENKASKAPQFDIIRKAKNDIDKALKTKRLIKTLAISILFSAALFILLIYLHRRYKKRTKKTIKEKEVKLLQKEALFQITKLEQEKAQSKIEEITIKLKQSNQLIKAIEDIEVESIDLKSLKQCTILTNEEWEIFKQKFSKFYPYFILKIKQKYPQLTTAEIRYLCLIKLDMSTSQIASSLGISPSSLRVTWYRIKKKINLEDQIQAAEFLEKNI